MTIQELRDALQKDFEYFKGERVSFEHGKERREVCNGCEKNVMNVCSMCLCPLFKKPYFKSHFLQEINPLTEKNEENKKLVTCPLGKWEQIDKKYL